MIYYSKNFLDEIYVQGYETLFFRLMWFHDFQKCWWFDFYLLLIFLRIRFNYSCGCQEWPPESIMFEVCYWSHLHLVCLKWINLFSISRSFLLYNEIYSERRFPVSGLWETPLFSSIFARALVFRNAWRTTKPEGLFVVCCVCSRSS